MDRLIKDNLCLDIVQYAPKMGEIKLPEGFDEKLKGKTLEEQIELFGVKTKTVMTTYSYGECDSSRTSEKESDFWGCSDVAGIIVKDDLIVGAVFDCFMDSVVYAFEEKYYCTYYVSDDDGVGSTNREDYVSLYFK